LAVSSLVFILVVLSLVTPWYSSELSVWARMGEDVFTMYKHPFVVYTKCDGDFCDLPGANPGFHSWDDVCMNGLDFGLVTPPHTGCENQLTLYVILWLIAALVAVILFVGGVKLLWATVAVNRDKRQCALFLFKWTPLYALIVVALLFIIVVTFPIAVPAAMDNDGECYETANTTNETPCRHAFGQYYSYGGAFSKDLEFSAKWGPTVAWYLLLCALIVSVLLIPLGCTVGICASKAAATDDINVFVPPGGFDYYPVDTTGNQPVAAPVQSFDQYVPGYNPGSFTLN